ncbi:MAG: non-lysosomal glucosylceramidase [Lentisphaeria bacterium]|nr:non-lysosomal glucosylceramidase [Lentisphaeria bacterium]
MKLEGDFLREVSFPLGGIGAGCIGLAGTGRLVDWEIFNSSGKGRFNGVSHFAVRIEESGRVRDFRLLQGDLPTPYSGSFNPGQTTGHSGFGWGPQPSLLAGWEHFEHCVFDGEFPFAKITFADEAFPGNASLFAWSPFVPGDSLSASLPCACFELTIGNPTSKTWDCAGIGVLSNPFPAGINRLSGSRLTVSGGSSEWNTGDLTLQVLEKDEDCSGQEYLYRGGWYDAMEMYHNDVMRGGRFRNRHYDQVVTTENGEPCGDAGVLAAHFSLAPGESRTVTFLLTWSIPLRRNTWTPDVEQYRVPNRWKNFYATVWKNSGESADFLAGNYVSLRAKTQRFHDDLFASTLPQAMLDGISGNLSTLKTPTCLRLEDGTFWGWEGIGPFWGSCQGSCQHVWNYAQALPFLFPDLERSMRESHLKYNLTSSGATCFRVPLPLGIKAEQFDFNACADGQFGEIMKFYRDWKLCGNDAWLKQWYPALKQMLGYAWSPENPDRWDPERRGVLTGRQHHTLDMELFGPSSWLTGHYLGALDALSRMAETVGDLDFARTCRELFAKGKKYCDETLFNGEYFGQKIDLADRSVCEKFADAEHYWNDEAKELKYQIGSGLEIDSVVADYYAGLYGLSRIFDPEKTRATLRAIYRYNFVREMRRVFNPWRSFSLNDESGVMMCSWPRGGKPKIPLPYNKETMNGFEWTFAAHLAMNGMCAEAAEIAEAIRMRYDGLRRNPWNEIECGSNYARSMAACGLIQACSGFSFDAGKKELGFAPKFPEKNFASFWSVGRAWGLIRFSETEVEFRVDGGSLELRRLWLPCGCFTIGKTISAGDAPLILNVDRAKRKGTDDRGTCRRADAAT